MNLICFDGVDRQYLLPLSATRPLALFRIGILTIAEKWEWHFKESASFSTQDYLLEKYPLVVEDDNLFVNGSVCPTNAMADAAASLKSGQALVAGGVLIVARLAADEVNKIYDFESLQTVEFKDEFVQIRRSWDIFTHNSAELERDFDRLTKGRTSSVLSSTNTLIGDRIFVEEGVKAEAAVFNSTPGAIYLGANSEVMEGSLVRGGLALCANAGLKLGSKIYGATTIGPYSKVGGEVNNSVIFGYSNKGHDGFLGNAVLGEWCNIGADSNNSNLKNNYEEVKLWSYPQGGFERTGLQFCGLFMGDHSKCGINTMFNTGTVVGVSANVFGAGFPRNFIPDFAWGGAGGFSQYRIDKALDTAARVMQRRNVELTEADRKIFQRIYNDTAVLRNFA